MSTVQPASQQPSARRGGRHARSRRGLRIKSLAMVALATGALLVVGFSPEAHASGSLTVTPSTDLATDAPTTVEVVADGLLPGVEVQIQQCTLTPGHNYCVSTSGDGAEDNGNYITTQNDSLDAEVPVSYNAPSDMACNTDTSQPTVVGCIVQVVYTTGAGGVAASAPIQFAGSVYTSAPNAVLSVTPSTGTYPLPVLADASASTGYGNYPISSFTYDFGDGTTPDQTEATTDPHTYSSPGTYTVTLTAVSTAGTSTQATRQVIVNDVAPPPPTATKVAFGSQPVDTTVGAPMKNPDGTTHVVQVLAENANGSTDATDQGNAILTLGGGTTGAHFTAGGTIGASGTTLTQPFVNGVASFSGIAVDTEGFRYTLTASSANLTPATSSTFDVATNATVCPTGQTCTVAATSPGTGQSAVVTAAPGPGTIVTASFGGNVATLHGCSTTAPGILTFNGNRQKTIKLTIATNYLLLKFCYGQPTPFIDVTTLRPTTFFSTANQEYEGILGPCLGRLIPPPCISGLSVGRGTETVTVLSGAGDPRMSH